LALSSWVAKLSHIVAEVEVFLPAKDLPEFITVDGQVEVGQIVHLSDLVLPKALVVAAHNNDLAII
jgi:hypothetical protein